MTGIWTEVAKQTGAIVLGLGGIYGTYVASRTKDREARRQDRLEVTYVVIAHRMANYVTALSAIERGKPVRDELRTRHIADEFGRILAQLNLYGSPAVVDATSKLVESIEAVVELAMTRSSLDRSGTEVLEAKISDEVRTARSKSSVMLRAMRTDLGAGGFKRRRRPFERNREL